MDRPKINEPEITILKKRISYLFMNKQEVQWLKELQYSGGKKYTPLLNKYYGSEVTLRQNNILIIKVLLWSKLAIFLSSLIRGFKEIFYIIVVQWAPNLAAVKARGRKKSDFLDLRLSLLVAARICNFSRPLTMKSHKFAAPWARIYLERPHQL